MRTTVHVDAEHALMAYDEGAEVLFVTLKPKVSHAALREL
jgi:hypothetical protein